MWRALLVLSLVSVSVFAGDKDENSPSTELTLVELCGVQVAGFARKNPNASVIHHLVPENDIWNAKDTNTVTPLSRRMTLNTQRNAELVAVGVNLLGAEQSKDRLKSEVDAMYRFANRSEWAMDLARRRAYDEMALASIFDEETYSRSKRAEEAEVAAYRSLQSTQAESNFSKFLEMIPRYFSDSSFRWTDRDPVQMHRADTLRHFFDRCAQIHLTDPSVTARERFTRAISLIRLIKRETAKQDKNRGLPVEGYYVKQKNLVEAALWNFFRISLDERSEYFDHLMSILKDDTLVQVAFSDNRVERDLRSAVLEQGIFDLVSHFTFSPGAVASGIFLDVRGQGFAINHVLNNYVEPKLITPEGLNPKLLAFYVCGLQLPASRQDDPPHFASEARTRKARIEAFLSDYFGDDHSRLDDPAVAQVMAENAVFKAWIEAFVAGN